MIPLDTNAIAIAFSVMLLGLFFVGCYIAARDTYWVKGGWGLNPEPLSCRQCDTLAPVIRLPKNPDQALWGGWTCFECGHELDEWGEPVERQPFTAQWSARMPEVRLKKQSNDIRRGGDYRE